QLEEAGILDEVERILILDSGDEHRVVLLRIELLAAFAAQLEEAAYPEVPVQLLLAELVIHEPVHLESVPQRQGGGDGTLLIGDARAEVDRRGAGARHAAAAPIVAHEVDRTPGA